MSMDMDESFVSRIASLARGGAMVHELPGGAIGLMKPSGEVQVFHPVDKPLPSDINQFVKAFDVESFAHYVNRFAIVGEGDSAKTTIFAHADDHKMKAIIDYHSLTKPDRCQHTITYDVPYSDQWRRWHSIDGRAIGQASFAEFLEENSLDIVDPASAVFLDIVSNLQSKKSVHFESGVRLQDGAQQLVYSENVETKGRGTISIPSRFSIGVPIYQAGEAYKVEALLRYRIEDGKVMFTVKLHRRTFLERTAFEDVCKKAHELTKLQVLNAWL
jgi:uncharacterized protein YfdQ (DUF2303 family)